MTTFPTKTRDTSLPGGVRSGVATALSAASDPIADVIAGVLSVPLRELYAVLFRAGLVQIVD